MFQKVRKKRAAFLQNRGLKNKIIYLPRAFPNSKSFIIYFKSFQRKKDEHWKI